MNWLAHLYLSEADVEARLGNLLADVVRGAARAGMSDAFRRGADCHRAIDAYTDSHPLVARSRARLGPTYRRFAGVLIDVFYDHLLARDWSRHGDGRSLEEFTEGVRAQVLVRDLAFPPPAQRIVQGMVIERRLLSYRTPEGIERALARISQRIEQRFGRDVALAQAMDCFAANEAGLLIDFEEFFPDLSAHLRRQGWSIGE